MDFEYTNPETGAVHKYSALGKDTYKLSDVLAEIGITGELSSAKLEIVSGEDLPGALFLTVIDGEYYISSGRAFTDEYKLTVIVDGVTYVITITDAAEYVTNIKDLLTSAVITVDGQKVTGETWKVRAEQEYQISLRFKETAAKQFSDDQEMVFNLPDGFVLTGLENGNTSTTFDVVVDGVTVSGNTIEIKTASNGKSYLAINWNQNDPHYDDLTSAGTTSIVVDIWGTFEAGTETVTFSDTVENEVEVDNRSNVSIQKTGYYDAENKKIHYTITATSVGESTNVVVTDAISGSAVKMESDDTISMTRTPKNGSATTSDVSSAKNGSGKGFSYNIGNMSNGETVTFEYTATVDPSLIAKSGQATFDETGNTVNIHADDDGDPKDDTSTHFESWITFNSSIKKNSVAIGDLQEIEQSDGTKKYYKTVTWKVELNPEKQVSMYGSDLKDSIADWDKNKMSYTGDGIRISMDGGAAQTVAWSAIGVTPDSTSTGIRNTSNKTWTYTFDQESDKGLHSYVVEYDTLVEIADQTQDLTVTNTTTGKPGSDTAYGPVNKGTQSGGGDEPGPTGPAIKKAVTSVDQDYVSWKINVVVSGEGYSSFTIDDIFPYAGYNYALMDSLVGVPQVSGLIGDETFTWEPAKYPTGNTEVDGIHMTFYQNEGKTIPGLKKNVVSGQGENEKTSDRVLTITLTTKNNEQWLEETVENSWNGQHINTAIVTVPDGKSQAEAKVFPRKTKLTKFAAGSDYESDTHGKKATVTIDGIEYPLYRFEIYLEGVTRETITLTDTFDTQALKIFDGHYDGEPNVNHPYIDYDLNTIMGGQNSNLSQGYTDRYPITVVETPTGAAITATLPKTTEGAYYPFYRIIYYLVPNGVEGLERMKQLAIDSDGTASLTNTASLDGSSTSSTYVEYTYKPVSKTVTGPVDGKYHYTVTLNPDKKRLNNGNPLPATDTFSGMAVDYTSITVTTDPADKKSEVSWDYSGNTGTFTIPDATKVVLEYDARPVGTTSTITMTNTIELKGSTVTTNTNATVNINGSGTAITARIYVLKYAAGDMTVPLSGAVFGLYEKSGADYVPVKYAAGGKNGQDVQFTTGTNGVAEVFLNQNTDGIYLQPEYYDSETGAVIEGKIYYLKELVAPDGYDLDDTYYQFKITDIPGNVTYGTNGEYVYLNKDVLKIVNKPEAGLRIKKIVSGVEELSQEEINRISFTVTGPGGYSRTIPYSDFVNGQYKLPDATDKTAHPGWTSLPTGTYTVTETVTTADGATFTTTYKVDSARTTTTGNAEATITADDIANNRDHVITVTNTYTPAEITVIKTDKTSGTKLAGATFKLEKQQAGGGYAVFANSALTAEGLFTFTDVNKDEGVTISGLLDGNYRLTETVAPDGGYAVLTTPVEFTVSDGTVTFTNGSSFEDGIVTLVEDTFTIANEKKQLIVKKEWVGGIPDNTTVYVRLFESADGGANWTKITNINDVPLGDYNNNIELNKNNSWTATIEGLDFTGLFKFVEYPFAHSSDSEGIASGGVIKYNNTTDYVVTYDNALNVEGTFRVTNTKVPTGIAVLKKWETDDNDLPDSISVTLKKGTPAASEGSHKVIAYLKDQNAGSGLSQAMMGIVADGGSVTIYHSFLANGWRTLTGVTDSRGSSVTYTSNGGDVTVSNITSDCTLYVNYSNTDGYFGTDYYLTVNTPGETTFSNVETVGTVEVLKSNNWYYEWTGLSSDYYYFVEETVPSGYDVTYTNNNGIKTGTITVTNTKTTPRTGSLAITKIVTNADTLADTKTFTFNVALTHSPAVDPSTIDVTGGTMGTATTSGDTVTIPVSVTGEGTVTLSNIPAGTTYVVTEPARNPADGWSQVGEVEYGDNTKTIAANDTDTATVTNTYSATGSVPFKAKKTFVGGTLSGNDFTFTLTEYESDFETVKTGGFSQSKTNAANGDIAFDEVALADTATRYFKIKETVPTGQDADGSIIYDTHETNVTVTVTDDGKGNLVYAKNPSAVEDYDATFVNTKKGALTITKAVTVDGSAEKAVSTKLADGTYSFTITGPNSYSHTGEITVTNGAAQNNISLTDLIPGEYIVTEATPTNGTAISKINADASSVYNTTVTVQPNQTETVAYTNDIETAKLTVEKKWLLNGTPTTEPKQFNGSVISAIDFNLFQKKPGALDGTQYGDTYTISSDNDWKIEIDVPKYVWDDTQHKNVSVSYYLQETTALDHYNTTITSNSVTVSKSDPLDVDSDKDVTITNSLYTVALPSTGGVGTGVVYGAGAALILLALLGLVLMNRKRSRGTGI